MNDSAFYEYFEDMHENTATSLGTPHISTSESTETASQILLKLDRILKTQQSIEARLAFLEAQQASTQQTQQQESTKWTDHEHGQYLRCLETFSKSQATDISAVLKTKTPKQVTAHSQRFFEKLERYYQKPLEQQDDWYINKLLASQEYIRHSNRAHFLKCAQRIQNYVESQNFEHIKQTQIEQYPQYALQLHPEMKSVGKCVVCAYLTELGVDRRTICMKVLQVLEAAQNIIVAAKYVAEQLKTDFEVVLLSIIAEQFKACLVKEGVPCTK